MQAAQTAVDMQFSCLQVHASEELTTVVDGEALVDDGIAAVLYAIFLVSLFFFVGKEHQVYNYKSRFKIPIKLLLS